MFDEYDGVEYAPLNEGDRVPSAGAMDCYTENGGYHDELGELCEGCYELVQDVEDEDESFSSNPERLIAMKKKQREVINGHLENLVKIAGVQQREPKVCCRNCASLDMGGSCRDQTCDHLMIGVTS
jgi:hypothetical protein